MRRRNQNLQRNAVALHALAKANSNLRKTMVANSNKDFVLALVQIVRDIIKGNVQLTPSQLNRLRPYEILLRRFISAKSSINERKHLLQSGGFLGVLIKPLLSTVLPSLLGALTRPACRRY